MATGWTGWVGVPAQTFAASPIPLRESEKETVIFLNSVATRIANPVPVNPMNSELVQWIYAQVKCILTLVSWQTFFPSFFLFSYSLVKLVRMECLLNNMRWRNPQPQPDVHSARDWAWAWHKPVHCRPCLRHGNWELWWRIMYNYYHNNSSWSLLWRWRGLFWLWCGHYPN